MPFHGRAEDGELTTAVGTKQVCNESFKYSRKCVVVRHPQAPGASRSTEQQAHDTASGLEWRDYALLCGPNNCVNGHEPGLGAGHWLYCDSAGSTWVVRIEQVDNTSDITFNVWLDGIFGRMGRQRTFTPRLLDSLIFAPPIPSWYGGSVTAADIVGSVGFNLYQNDAGTSAIINLVCLEPYSYQVYPETCYYDYITGSLAGPALIGTATITLSGNGDLDDDGVGITGAIADDLAFEAGLVISRSSGGSALSTYTGDTRDFIKSADPDCPTTSPDTLTHQMTYEGTDTSGNPLSGSASGTGSDYRSILQKTLQGTVERRVRRRTGAGSYSNTYSGTITGTFNLSTGISGCQMDCDNFQGIYWQIDSCSWSGSVTRTFQVDRYDYIDVEFNVFGQTFSYAYEYHYAATNVYNMFPDDYNSCSCAGQGSPSQGSDTQTEAWTMNGSPLSGEGTIYHDFRPFAQNAMYLAIDYSNGSVDGVRFHENFVVINDSGVSSKQLTQDYDHVPLLSSPRMPDSRHWVWSYQPVTEEFTSAPKSSTSASYAGTVYQYV